MADDFRPNWTGRLQDTQSTLASSDLDALVVSTPLNIAYLCGFTGSAGLLIISRTERILLVDGRYNLSVRESIARGTVALLAVERAEPRYDTALAALVSRLGTTRVGFEAGHLTVATLEQWRRRAGNVQWTATERLVEKQRAIKDAGEVAIFRRAGRMIASVVGDLRAVAIRERTEQDVAAAIDAALIRTGFSKTSFPTIVASGPNSALPHARPTGRKLAEGDLVVLDFGGVLDGYCVDLTRMAAVGQLASRAEALYTAVLAAHAAAVSAVHPGIATSVIDTAARSVLAARGLGEAFLHSTGHGLGLEVHEAPRIGRPDPEAEELVEANMVFTIEPGAYLEGIGGVRLEDDVLVTAGGCEVLTNAPRDLLVV